MCVSLSLTHTQIHLCVSVSLSLSLTHTLSCSRRRCVWEGECVRGLPPPLSFAFSHLFFFSFSTAHTSWTSPPFLLCERNRMRFVGKICVALTLKIETKIYLVFFNLCHNTHESKKFPLFSQTHRIHFVWNICVALPPKIETNNNLIFFFFSPYTDESIFFPVSSQTHRMHFVWKNCGALTPEMKNNNNLVFFFSLRDSFMHFPLAVSDL